MRYAVNYPKPKVFGGRFEIRCKLPKTKGFWPAFWLYANGDDNNDGLYDFYEMDIFEHTSSRPKKIYTNLHTREPGTVNSDLSFCLADHCYDEPFANKLHVYAFEWDDIAFKWYFDDALIRTEYRYYELDTNGKPFTACQNVPIPWGAYHCLFYPDGSYHLQMIANVAIPVNNEGTGFTGTPDASTLFPNQMEIDYIRVYQRVPQAGLTDLCKPTIIGQNFICDNSEYIYNVQLPSVNPNDNNYFTNWTVSENLQKISATNSTITINKKAGTNGGAWVKFSVNGSICKSENIFNIWVGKPKISVNKSVKNCCAILKATINGGTFTNWTIDGRTFTNPNIIVCKTNSGIGIYTFDNEAALLGTEPEVPENNAPHQYGYPISYTASATNKCGTTTVTGTALLCE